MRYVPLVLVGLATGGLLSSTLSGCGADCECPEPKEVVVEAGTYARGPDQLAYEQLADGGVVVIPPTDQELQVVVSADRRTVIETYLQAGQRVENRYEVRSSGPGHTGPVCGD
jgi:hypothetical protein